MKAKRRHDLKTNELAQSLVFFQQHGMQVVAAVVVVALVGAVYGYYQYASGQSAAAEWQEFDDIGTTAAGEPSVAIDLARNLAGRTSDRALARLCLQFAAQVAWSEARTVPGTPQATEMLTIAETAYQEIAENPDHAEATALVATAYRGLAAIAEERGKESEARDYYKKIIDDTRFEGTPARAVAEEQITELADRMAPIEIADAQLAPALSILPTTQPATTTRPAPATQPAAATTQPARPATTQPAAAATQPVRPATTQPAATQPAATAPATQKTPPSR